MSDTTKPFILLFVGFDPEILTIIRPENEKFEGNWNDYGLEGTVIMLEAAITDLTGLKDNIKNVVEAHEKAKKAIKDGIPLGFERQT